VIPGDRPAVTGLCLDTAGRLLVSCGEEEIPSALTHSGTPSWTGDDLDALVRLLGHTGHGDRSAGLAGTILRAMTLSWAGPRPWPGQPGTPTTADD
jgi:hypothetical protein